jgi:hypothetical protein
MQRNGDKNTNVFKPSPLHRVVSAKELRPAPSWANSPLFRSRDRRSFVAAKVPASERWRIVCESFRKLSEIGDENLDDNMFKRISTTRVLASSFEGLSAEEKINLLDSIDAGHEVEWYPTEEDLASVPVDLSFALSLRATPV